MKERRNLEASLKGECDVSKKNRSFKDTNTNVYLEESQEKLKIIKNKMRTILQSIGVKSEEEIEYFTDAIMICIEKPGEINGKPKEIYGRLAKQHGKKYHYMEETMQNIMQRVVENVEDFPMAKKLFGPYMSGKKGKVDEAIFFILLIITLKEPELC